MATAMLNQLALSWRRVRRSRAWRLPATAVGFGIFGLGAAFLSVSFFPLLYLAPLSVEQKQRWSRLTISSVFRLYLKLLNLLGLITYELHNTDELRQPGQLIIANHPSLLDVVFIIALTGDASCVVKGSLWSNPFTAFAVRVANYIGNSSDNMFARCVTNLQQGHSLIVFPEGTRSQPDQPLKFHRGPSNMALSAGVDITPVVIRCEPATLLKCEKWYDISPEPPHFTLRVYEKISVGGYMANGQAQATAARQLTRDLTAFFSERRGASAVG